MQRKSPFYPQRKKSFHFFFALVAMLSSVVLLYAVVEYCATYRALSVPRRGPVIAVTWSAFDQHNTSQRGDDARAAAAALNPAEARRRWPVQPSSPRHGTDALEPLMLGAAVCEEASCTPRSQPPRNEKTVDGAVHSVIWASWEDATEASTPSTTNATLLTEQFIRLVDRMHAGSGHPAYHQAPTLMHADAAGRITHTTSSAEPFIDAVITHVDTSDPEWRAALSAAHKENDAASVDFRRFRDLGELRYTLRSIYRHASQLIRRVVLVVADERHVPSWANRSSPFIYVVTHADLMPCATAEMRARRDHLAHCEDESSRLPTFNSYAIESVVHRIPGLSKFFLNFNNDMLLGRELSFLDIFRPVLASPLHNQQAELLDAALLEQAPSTRATDPQQWAGGNGPVVMRVQSVKGGSRVFFQFEAAIYAEKKGHFADCTTHNEDHGREPGSVYCFRRHKLTSIHPYQPSLLRQLTDRVLRTKCNIPLQTRGHALVRETKSGVKYTLTDGEPDPCDYISVEAYYDAYVTGHARGALPEANGNVKVAATVAEADAIAHAGIARARAWHTFQVFPWHVFAHFPLLADRDVLRVALDTDVYGLSKALKLTRRHQLRRPASFFVTYHAAHMLIAERRAVLANRNKMEAVPLCDRLQDRGRRLSSSTAEGAALYAGQREGRSSALCVDTENDIPLGMDPAYVPRDAMTAESTNASSTRVLAKLFRSITPMHGHESYMFAEVTNQVDILRAVRRIKTQQPPPLFVTVNDGFDSNLPVAEVRTHVEALLEAATQGIDRRPFEV